MRLGDAWIRYADEGRGPAILLIQGAGAVGEAWRPQIDALSRSFRCVSFDNRGIGGSDLPPTALTIEAMAGRLKEIAGIPTLVMSATEDRIAEPRFGRELAKLIPDARYVEIENAGHGVTIQLADEVNDLLLEHLRAAEAVSARS